MTVHGLEPDSVDVAGGNVVYYQRAGSGTPLLLLHGIGCEAAHWSAVTPALAASGRPVIAVDLPGHGMSQPNPGHQKLDDLVHAVTAVMDHLDVDRAHCVGHSLGGGLSLLLADVAPARVASLTLVASGGLGTETNPLLRFGAVPGAWLGLRLAVNKPTVAALRAAASTLAAVGVRPYELAPSVLGIFDHLTDSAAQDAFMETLLDSVNLSGQKRTAADRLAEFDGSRVCLLWCADDPVIPVTHGYQTHAALPGSQFHVFGGKSHEPQTADPQRFTSLVLEHVEQCDRQQRRTVTFTLPPVTDGQPSERASGRVTPRTLT